MNNDNIKTRDKILHCSAILFALCGYNGVSMRDIAKRVDIKASSIYSHFKSKDDILNNLMDYYKTNIVKYYPTDKEIDESINSKPVIEVLQLMNVTFSSNDFDMMFACTCIIIREQFNNKVLSDLFILMFEKESTKRIEKLLYKLVKKRKIEDCNIKAIAFIWVQTFNSLAMKLAREYSKNNLLDSNFSLSTSVQNSETNIMNLFEQIIKMIVIL